MGFSISASERQIGETNRPPLLVMLLSAAGYYCGAMIGFALTFEPVPISIFWPPMRFARGTAAFANSQLVVNPHRCLSCRRCDYAAKRGADGNGIVLVHQQ